MTRGLKCRDLTLLFQELVRIRFCLQCVAQVRDSHAVLMAWLDVSFVANLKSSPPRVRDPAVLFGLTFLQQCVANCSRKWDVNGSVCVHMSDLRFPKSEFFTPKPMRVSGDVRPSGNFVLQPF